MPVSAHLASPSVGYLSVFECAIIFRIYQVCIIGLLSLNLPSLHLSWLQNAPLHFLSARNVTVREVVVAAVWQNFSNNKIVQLDKLLQSPKKPITSDRERFMCTRNSVIYLRLRSVSLFVCVLWTSISVQSNPANRSTSEGYCHAIYGAATTVL